MTLSHCFTTLVQLEMSSMDIDKEAMGIPHGWKYLESYRTQEKDVKAANSSQNENSTTKLTGQCVARISNKLSQEVTKCNPSKGEESQVNGENDCDKELELRLQGSVSEKTNLEADNECIKNDDKVYSDVKNDRETPNNNNENIDTNRVKTTAFSVADILDPNKFVGCHSEPRVWHPWLRDEGVRDYSRSNLEKGRESKGSLKNNCLFIYLFFLIILEYRAEVVVCLQGISVSLMPVSSFMKNISIVDYKAEHD